MSDEKLERIELKIAFLERANNELSDVVYRQQQELAALTEKIAAVAGRVESMKAGEQMPYTLEDERPPHY